ncbi:hypothetical protein JYT90_00285, partial [bacterium AH-315-P07]|nr:hypothetical protein [bacterium AH-315-P07]
MIRPLSYLLVFLFAAIPCFASDYDTYIQSLENGTEQQRVIARQMLPREGIRAVPDLIKLLHHEDGRTWRAAKNVLSDICHAITLPGYERERGETTDQLMALFWPDYPLHVAISALRLLAIVTPEGHDLGPIPLYSSIDRNFSKALRSEVIDALVVMNTKSA